MTIKEFLKRYDEKDIFDEYELKQLFNCDFDFSDTGDEYKIVEEIYGENRRWSRMVELYVCINGRYFCFYCDEGLTEHQENEYWQQPEEVREHRYKKMIEIVEWERI